MELLIETIGDVTIAHLKGEHLDASTVKDFKAAAEPALEKSMKMVFDMSGLQFVDSSGIGAIISCLRKLNAKGGDLKLCGLSKPVRSLFELVRMHRIFDIFDSKEQAAAAFSNT
jgi:anti-sigma B factor antagonist